MTMNSLERLKKAKVQLMTRNPFFSVLCFYLKVEEDTKGVIEEGMGIAVDSRGVMYYKDEYIKTLTDEQLIGVLCHEILHLSLLHLLRRGERHEQRWDMATDLSANSILLRNGFKLPNNAITPDNNDIYASENVMIMDCSKKTAEEIYSLFPLPPPQQKPKSGDNKNNQNQGKQDQKGGQGDNNQNQNPSQGDGSGKNQGKGQSNKNQQGEGQGQDKSDNQNQNSKRFDSHISDNRQNQERKDTEDEWKDRTEQASVIAKQRGTLPLGLERLIGELYKEKIKWRALLQRYIQQLLPTDYSWSRPSKKSIPVGTYLPATKKEKIDICVGIDTSGSIGQTELNDFLSEMIGIARSYQNSVDMRVLSHDVDVHTDTRFTNANEHQIKKIKVKGGGGTSHLPIMKYINEKVINCRVGIFFTDGYSDLDEVDFKKNRFSSIFVISKEGNDEQLEKKRVLIVKLREEK